MLRQCQRSNSLNIILEFIEVSSSRIPVLGNQARCSHNGTMIEMWECLKCLIQYEVGKSEVKEELKFYTACYIEIKTGDLSNSKKCWRAFDSCPTYKGM
jgi:hypothetical protein